MVTESEWLLWTSYPEVDPLPEAALRERLRHVLAGASATPADSVILGIVKALGIAYPLLVAERGDLSRGDLARRIDAVSEDSAAGAAVARAVQVVNAAVMAAITASTTTTTTG